MLKQTELRIGSFIKDKESGRIGQVIGISSSGRVTAKMEFSKLNQKTEEFEPIELNEDCLIKFGFERNKGKFGTYFKSPHDKQVRIYFYDNKWCIGYVSDNSAKFSTIGSFIYVHKLQNFHFEFVGQELTIKTN